MPTTHATAHAKAGMIARLNHPDYDRWATQIRATGGCRQPIHLRGKIDHYDKATGQLLHRYTTKHEPDGVLRVPCKTRRASRCPTCAETYRADTYHLIRAGLVGGKGVPDTVTSHPTLFITLTAPSFGTVHTRHEKNGKTQPCHARRNAPTCPHGRTMSCTTRHSKEDPPASANHSAPTATTTPAPSCSTPWPHCCGSASPTPYAATSPNKAASSSRTSATTSPSPSPKSPNTNGAASSTSTPSSASTAPAAPKPHPHPGRPPTHSPKPSSTQLEP
ncbi:hypothetical protein GCM10020001_055790 [Nonomuraea salmonea]